MKTQTCLDKSEWGDGPWQSEPDLAHWIDETTGLYCMIRRVPVGALCGYVGVPKGHLFYKTDCTDSRISKEGHGGLTYSGDGDAEGATVWWLGFDCGHYMDLVPALYALMPSLEGVHGVYRSFDYVVDQVQELASRLEAIAKPLGLEHDRGV